MKNKLFKILLLISPICIGLASSLLTKDMVLSYDKMSKPFPMIKPIVFPIVWTILYILMGIGAMLVYGKKKEHEELVTIALLFNLVQLILNFFWSLIFFNARRYTLAFIWIILIAVIVVMMLVNYRKVSKLAFYLNIPYIIWLVFASYLNLSLII